MNVEFYKTFAIYSVLQLFIQLIFAFILEKLYYEEENTKANKYSITFNILNFVTLIGSSIITKNQIIIISVTLISILLFTIYIAIKTFNKFKFKINIIYTCNNICSINNRYTMGYFWCNNNSSKNWY